MQHLIKFKNATGDVIYTEIGDNIAEVQKCGIPSNVDITDVELTMSYKANTHTFKQTVRQIAIPTTKTPTTKLTGDYEMLLF